VSTIFSLGKLTIYIGLIFILFSSEAEAEKQVPFLFAEDEALSDSGDFYDQINKSDEIGNDEFLQSPLTKLDYVLMKLEDELQGHESSINSRINDYFDNNIMGSGFNFSVRYIERTGRIVFYVKVMTLGKPKQPMKKFCDEIIKHLQIFFPQEPKGYLMYHQSLGILERKGSFSSYKSSVENITRNHSYLVDLHSMYKAEKDNSHYYLKCVKVDSKSPTQYETMSIGTPKK
jgi:hypothetical protein